MELLEGETLSERLVQGALSTDQVLRFGIEIADALDRAHRQSIVHRDLKPGNIMLTRSGVKLLDFGLAKVMAPPLDKSAVPRSDVDADAGRLQPHAGGLDPRDLRVHGSRTARGKGGGRAHGHLRVRRRSLRDGDGPEGLLGHEPGVADLQHHEGGARGDLDGPADDAARTRSGRAHVSREGPRRSVPDRARREAPAPVDRGRRLAGRRARSRHGPSKEPRAPRLGCCRRSDPRRRVRDVGICPPRAGRSSGPTLLDPAPGQDGFRGRRRGLRIADHIAGRPEDHIRGQGRGGPEAALASAARRRRRPVDSGDGRRDVAVLVSRQPVHRFLRGREVEEGRRRRRAPAHPVRGDPGKARILEPGRGDPLLARHDRRGSSRLRRRRRRDSGDAARRIERGDDTPLGHVSSGRPPLPLHGRNARYRRRDPDERDLPRVPGLEGSKASPRRPIERRLRVRLPDLRAREDAPRSALRREAPSSDRRPRSSRRLGSLRSRLLPGGLFRFGQRDPGLCGGRRRHEGAPRVVRQIGKADRRAVRRSDRLPGFLDFSGRKAPGRRSPGFDHGIGRHLGLRLRPAVRGRVSVSAPVRRCVRSGLRTEPGSPSSGWRKLFSRGSSRSR